MSALLTVILQIMLWVSAMCLVAGVAIVGPNRLYEFGRNLGPRLYESRYPIAGLIGVVVFSAVGRGPLEYLSRIIGVRMTGTIYALEGDFVGWMQATFVTPELTMYFSWIYVYGYVFLLVFPFIAYGAMRNPITFKRLIAAYAFNYGLGLLCYTVILAYGPRNVMPDIVTSLLYTYNPDFQALTTEVNRNTNVFPSLHTSLAVTVAIFAALTRRSYPAWTPIAGWLAVSVMIATMYLGIHWLVDVIAGVGLAGLAVYLSYRFIDPPEQDEADVGSNGSAQPTD